MAEGSQLIASDIQKLALRLCQINQQIEAVQREKAQLDTDNERLAAMLAAEQPGEGNGAYAFLASVLTQVETLREEVEAEVFEVEELTREKLQLEEKLKQLSKK